ncbi:hypothetical protein BLNAU_16760 [Blattamonas nauphoetae]|uniref:Uncharacterized protein n=1 Tax=Blattamonas nauphoetae TaxID=2049346 RepID=A0ABQ9XDD6_9EUKA|nr:hypothetical protein BLNAU_16760 [Blattamonas nauphoetae]
MISILVLFILVTSLISGTTSPPLDHATVFSIGVQLEIDPTHLKTSKIALLDPFYHAEEYLLDSMDVSLWGDKTTILHSSSVRQHPNSQQKARKEFYIQTNLISAIFLISNTSIFLSDIHFDCGKEGISLSKISSSTLALKTCSIVSNSQASPFVLFATLGRDETSVSLIDTTHTSSSPHTLLPLGIFGELTPPPSDHSRHGSTRPLHSIHCVSMSLSDCTLLRGTGPLMDFSSVPSDSGDFRTTEIGVETFLVAGSFRNVTSSPSQNVPRSSLFSQKIIGTSVTHSNNHLTGTTSLDMNRGGDLLCQNSSFSHCDSSLEPSEGPHYALQHRSSSDTQYHFDSSTTASEIIFTRCTFHTMIQSEQGSAIYHDDAPSSLSISECSFARVLSTKAFGGAVSFYHSAANYPFTLTSSSFVNCSCYEFGRSVGVRFATTATISSSFFQNSTVTRPHAAGGGMAFVNVTSIIISNSVFQHCYAGEGGQGGGALFFQSCISLRMASAQFRENYGYYGNDFYSFNFTVAALRPNVTNCDSTSGNASCYFYVAGGGIDNSVIPQTTTNRTLRSIEARLEPDGVSATLLATVSDVVEGMMLVLVDNSELEGETTSNSAPKIQRLLAFPFPFPYKSTTSSFTAACGDWEILQHGETYSVIGQSINGTNLTSNSLTLVMPFRSQFNRVVCRTGAGLDHAWLCLVGKSIFAGTYDFQIEGIDNFQLSVSFDGLTEGETLDMVSTEVSISLFGEGSKFSPNTQYEVNLVMKEGSSEPVFLDPSRLLFTTPDPPRLTNVGEVRFTDDSKSTIEIDLVCLGLPSSADTLVVSSANGTKISLSVEWSDSSSGKATAVVYSLRESEIELKFGQTYTISSLTSTDGVSAIFIAPLTFQTPADPARIVSVSAALNDQRTHVVVTMRGRALPSDSFSMSLSELPSETFTGSQKSIEIVEFEISLDSNTTPHLDYDTVYTLQALSSDGIHILLNAGMKFDVPSRALVVIVSGSGSNDITFCGTHQKPCLSISVGWERDPSEQADREVVVQIDKQAGFGGGVEVGKMSLTIVRMFGRKGEIVVEEEISTPKGKEGLLMVSGGEVILSALSLSLPSFTHTLSSTHPLFVIGGSGKCSIEQVRISGIDGEHIGMGLCGLVSGHLSFSDISIKACSFRDGVSLISHSEPSNELAMILSDVVVENCTVLNAPLLLFHSTHPSSSFSLANSQFVSTRMTKSSSSQTAKGLVTISTTQTKIEFVGCVFVDCGSLEQNDVLCGTALHIDIGSSSTNTASSSISTSMSSINTDSPSIGVGSSRWEVSLDSCLFVNNSGVGSGDSSGGVWISCGDRLCLISFTDSWFEEDLASTALKRNAHGRIVLVEQTKKRRVVHGGSESRAAVVVERGRLVPQIIRKSSIFSNCRLVVRSSQPSSFRIHTQSDALRSLSLGAVHSSH